MHPHERLKHSSRRRQRCRWRKDQEEEMLAWLDYCHTKDANPNYFKQTITARLGRTCGRRFTLEQVDRKIQHLWKIKRCESPEWHDHSCVYYLGTKALYTVEDDGALLARIKARVEQMENEALLEFWSSATSGSSIRLTRSRGSALPVRHNETHIETIQTTLPRRKQPYVEIPKKNQEQRPLQGNGEQEAPASSDSHSPDPPNPPFSGRCSPGQTWLEPSEIPDSEQFERSLSLLPPSTSPINTPDTEETSSLTTKTARTSITEEGSTPKPCSRHKVDGQPSSAYESWSCGSAECRKLHIQLLDRKKEVEYWRMEAQNAVSKVKILETRLHSQEAVNAALEKSTGKSAMDLLYDYRLRNDELSAKLNDKEILSNFTRNSTANPVSLDCNALKKNMHDICVDIASTLVYAETLQPCGEIAFDEKTGDLHTLLNWSLGGMNGGNLAVSFHSLVRSLISAAVCEWVFLEPLDEEDLSSNLRVEVMLEVLATRDGEDRARNLDFAANHRIINDKSFQTFLISRRVERLTTRLSSTLTPIFTLQAALTGWKIDILKKWEKENTKLAGIFSNAITLKTKALVSKDMFEFILPLPGERFDERYMEDHLKQPVLSGFVKLCVGPGLRIAEYDRKRVDDDSFRRASIDSEGRFDILAKAVVLLEEE